MTHLSQQGHIPNPSQKVQPTGEPSIQTSEPMETIVIQTTTPTKETISKMNRHPTEWKRICAYCISDEGIVVVECKVYPIVCFWILDPAGVAVWGGLWNLN